MKHKLIFLFLAFLSHFAFGQDSLLVEKKSLVNIISALNGNYHNLLPNRNVLLD